MADRLYAETKQYLINHVMQLLNKVQEGGDSQLIKNYYHYWSQYSEGVSYLHFLYFYLNQQHIRTQKLSDAEIIYGSADSSGGEQMEIGELALEVWHTGIIFPLGHRLVRLLLEAIDQDRAQGTTSVPIEAVRATILSFVEVSTVNLWCLWFFCEAGLVLWICDFFVRREINDAVIAWFAQNN